MICQRTRRSLKKRNLLAGAGPDRFFKTELFWNTDRSTWALRKYRVDSGLPGQSLLHRFSEGRFNIPESRRMIERPGAFGDRVQDYSNVGLVHDSGRIRRVLIYHRD